MAKIEWSWITEGVCKQAIVGDEAYYLRLDPDGLIRLRNDTVGTLCNCFWPNWPDAVREASIAVAFEAERAKCTNDPGWLVHRELNRRYNGASWHRGNQSWSGSWFCWYSERHTREENIAMYKAVVALPENASIEEIAAAMGREMHPADSHPKPPKRRSGKYNG